MSQNTKIEYLYRDCSNWKVWNVAVVAGEITEKQKKAILAALDSGEYFIPNQVGLPEQRFDEYNEDDHCWFELGEYSFSLTDAKPTVQMTVEDLTRAFTLSKGNWQDGVSFAPSKLPFSAQLESAQQRLQVPTPAELLGKEPQR